MNPLTTPELQAIAIELAQTGRQMNKAFGDRINQLIDGHVSPHEYAPLINDHANHTTVLTKLIYMISVWEETC